MINLKDEKDVQIWCDYQEETKQTSADYFLRLRFSNFGTFIVEVKKCGGTDGHGYGYGYGSSNGIGIGYGNCDDGDGFGCGDGYDNGHGDGDGSGEITS